jgi:hypothetical protein
MGKGVVYRTFIYFLCFSFLLLTGGFPGRLAEAKEGGLPIGEMISRGEVTFEARQNVWTKVDPFHFPIFQGVRIKTGNGLALVVLTNECQIEIGQGSLFCFHQNDQFLLFHGGVSFRIPIGAQMSFRVGNLSIGKPPRLEAATGAHVSAVSEETVGSIALHPNGSVTIKSMKGPLSAQNQEHVVLAALSQGESVTIPSAAAWGEQGQVVAQVGEIGEYPTGKALTEEFLGLSKTTWMFIALAAVAAAGAGITLAVTSDGDKDEFILPIIPVSP